MAKIGRVEDIEAWKKGRELAKVIYTATSAGGFGQDPALRDQIRRAVVSVPSNITEGFERGGDKEFRQFLAQAKGSTGEVKTHLYVALDVGYLSQPKFDELYRLAAEAGRLVGGFMRYLSRSSLRGSKYRKSAAQD